MVGILVGNARKTLSFIVLKLLVCFHHAALNEHTRKQIPLVILREG